LQRSPFLELSFLNPMRCKACHYLPSDLRLSSKRLRENVRLRFPGGAVRRRIQDQKLWLAISVEVGFTRYQHKRLAEFSCQPAKLSVMVLLRHGSSLSTTTHIFVLIPTSTSTARAAHAEVCRATTTTMRRQTIFRGRRLIELQLGIRGLRPLPLLHLLQPLPMAPFRIKRL